MMNHFAFVAIFAVIATIAAYDFNDPLFNQLLAEEYEGLEDSLDQKTNVRNRRDEEAVQDKCKYKKKKLCCGDESFEALHEKEKDLKKECFKEVTGKDWAGHGHHGHHHHHGFDPLKCDTEKIEKVKKEMTCVAQCVGQKKNLLDSAGNIKEADLKTLVRAYMTNESWFSAIEDKVLSTCFAEAKEAADNQDTSAPESSDAIKDQKSCDRLKEKLKRKQELFGGH